MNAEIVFSIANYTAIVGWLLLVCLPRWTGTRKIVLSLAIPLLLSAAYLVLIILFFRPGEGGFGSLAEVAKLFSNQWLLLAGWIHYLAFDLFVGVWEVKDAEKRGVSHWFVIPCLILTFLLGPIGFLLYYVVRLAAPNKTAKGETEK